MTSVIDDRLVSSYGRESPRPGLQRAARLYRALLAGESAAPTQIAIAGTNGKGSTVAALEHACLGIGLRTLTFTSPHLRDVRERIRVNGQMLPEAFWLTSLDRIAGACRDLGLDISYFEAIFGVALLACRAHEPQVAIWEAGLGGRLDAINVIESFECVVLTSVGLDHCEMLGNSTLQIAREKVALARRLSPLVLGDVESQVLDELLPELHSQRVLVMDARERLPDRWSASLDQLQQAMPWLTMVSARAVIWALVALDRWQPDDIDWLTLAAPRGRMDRSVEPWIVDVGHNPDAARNLCRTLASQGSPELQLCFNALQRKDVMAMAAELARYEHWQRVWIYDDGGLEFHPADGLVELFRRAGFQTDTIKGQDFPASLPKVPMMIFGSFRLIAQVLSQPQ